jgi:hypothetical protein
MTDFRALQQIVFRLSLHPVQVVMDTHKNILSEAELLWLRTYELDLYNLQTNFGRKIAERISNGVGEV